MRKHNRRLRDMRRRLAWLEDQACFSVLTAVRALQPTYPNPILKTRRMRSTDITPFISGLLPPHEIIFEMRPLAHVTDTQLIQIAPGSLGVAGGTPIPPVNSILNQGGRNLTTSGTQLTQPLTTLLKIKPANDMARAELKASREKAQVTHNDVALAVHQLYYKVLIAEAHRSATEARIKASQDLQSERVQQVKLGSALEQELIESRAQFLQAKQELLSTDLQLSDLKLKLNDLMGLPLTTGLALDPAITEYQEMCRREECVAAATASHPEISASHGEVEKAEAAVRLAKVDIRVPDVEAFARYSYQNQVPFLARNAARLRAVVAGARNVPLRSRDS